MLFLTLPLHELVSYAGDASIVEAVWFIGVATLIGVLLGSTSFQISRRSTRKAFVSRATKENHDERVAAQASLYQLGRLPSGLSRGTADLPYEQARALFITCKMIIQKEAAELSTVLIEKEAEINLTAMLSPAVLVFAFAVACRAGELHELGLRWTKEPWQLWLVWRFGVIALSLWFVAASRNRFLQSRIDEEKTTLRISLNLHPSLSNPQSP